MLESELRQFLGQAADRSLGRLEDDIWAATAVRMGGRRIFRTVLAVQTAVLAGIMVGSVLAEHRLVNDRSRELDVFSSRPSLAVSTLFFEGDR